jgi:hypothetical protein
MFENTNWRWVREWTGKVFLAAFLLGTFGYLTGSPVIRAGGVMAALPEAMGYAALAAIVIAAVAGIALAHYSNKKGGRHSS